MFVYNRTFIALITLYNSIGSDHHHQDIAQFLAVFKEKHVPRMSHVKTAGTKDDFFIGMFSPYMFQFIESYVCHCLNSILAMYVKGCILTYGMRMLSSMQTLFPN